MKVLLVADEFFSWGIYGGFGAFTRKLGRELTKRSIEVNAIIHHISTLQKPVGETEIIDGVNVVTLPRKKLGKLRNKKLYVTDADIIHSQCGMYDSYLTFKRNPNKKKILTFQDLRTEKEFKETAPLEVSSGYPWYKALWAKYVKRCQRKAVQQANLITVQAKLLTSKVHAIYSEDLNPVFLPNFIDIPKHNFKKTKNPSVVWLARLDPIKRPELCFELALKMPDVTFYILGKAHDEARDKMLRSKWQNISNLHFLGFQSGKVKEETLSKAWILVNTSIYECLPVSFLEGMAHKCALLSTRNPDDYTNLFGVHVEPNVKALVSGLTLLLANECWRGLGEKGYQHIKRVHSTEKGVDAHIMVYRKLLGEI